MNELNRLLPGQEIKVGEELIHLRPFTFGQLPKVITLVGNMGEDIIAVLQTLSLENSELVLNEKVFTTICNLCEKHWDSVTELIVLGTGKPATWVNEVAGAEGVELLFGTITGNWSFFRERLNPIIAQTKAQLAAKKPKTGSAGKKSSLL